MPHSQNSSSSNPVANYFAKIFVTGFELLSKLILWPKSSRQSFHQFSRFPAEIRLKIWKLAIPDKLIILPANGIHDDDDPAEREYSEFLVQTVGFARICREARSVIVDSPYTPMPPISPRFTKDSKWWDCSITRYLLNIESWKITFRNSNVIISGRRISNANENLVVEPVEPVETPYPQWLYAELVLVDWPRLRRILSTDSNKISLAECLQLWRYQYNRFFYLEDKYMEDVQISASKSRQGFVEIAWQSRQEVRFMAVEEIRGRVEPFIQLKRVPFLLTRGMFMNLPLRD